ncbi:hypothetical protein [Pararhizobium sp. O133]|uniref:hypothetical protein n=1 Tax=Pararhizobium sp. O133 TaxID=3449278 RepID=UPI003F686C3F
MSFHHRMMLQRYGLGIATSMQSQVNGDPILTPLFTSILTSGAIGMSAATAATVASVGSAISAGGDYWEFSL